MSARKPRAFANAAAFRAWLSRHHQRTAELLVRCFKVHARGRGITYSEALDEALCFGWIDGVRRGLDADSFTVRFTPRRPKSVWSNVNVRHAQRLEAEGRMAPAGLAAFRARVASRSGVYSFESRPLALDRPLERKLRAHRAAWKFHQSRPPGYRRTAAHWVMSAKRQETRERRLAILIEHAARGEPLPLLAPARPRAKGGS